MSIHIILENRAGIQFQNYEGSVIPQVGSQITLNVTVNNPPRGEPIWSAEVQPLYETFKVIKADLHVRKTYRQDYKVNVQEVCTPTLEKI